MSGRRAKAIRRGESPYRRARSMRPLDAARKAKNIHVHLDRELETCGAGSSPRYLLSTVAMLRPGEVPKSTAATRYVTRFTADEAEAKRNEEAALQAERINAHDVGPMGRGITDDNGAADDLAQRFHIGHDAGENL